MLEGLGAKIASRLGKEVTHVVFQRQRNASKQEQLAEDSELRNLFEKTAKVGMTENQGLGTSVRPSEVQNHSQTDFTVARTSFRFWRGRGWHM
jgi:hypothetical protein